MKSEKYVYTIIAPGVLKDIYKYFNIPLKIIAMMSEFEIVLIDKKDLYTCIKFQLNF